MKKRLPLIIRELLILWLSFFYLNRIVQETTFDLGGDVHSGTALPASKVGACPSPMGLCERSRRQWRTADHPAGKRGAGFAGPACGHSARSHLSWSAGTAAESRIFRFLSEPCVPAVSSGTTLLTQIRSPQRSRLLLLCPQLGPSSRLSPPLHGHRACPGPSSPAQCLLWVAACCQGEAPPAPDLGLRQQAFSFSRYPPTAGERAPHLDLGLRQRAFSFSRYRPTAGSFHFPVTVL